MSKDVFVSHSSQDRASATAVCRYLEAQGLRCWIAPRDIVPGESWGESIVRALDACSTMVLVLTTRANDSRHVVREVERADSKGARIISLRLDAVALNPTLEYFLSAQHWLDASTGPIETHLPALMAAVRAQRDAPAQRRAMHAAQAPLAAISERELIHTFDELAPDDWNRTPRGKIAGFFRGLLSDR